MTIELTENEAWLIGFELGYQACVVNDELITPEDFVEKMASGELIDLLLMANVGRDDHNGIWTIVGIRMAIYMLLLAEWDHKLYTDREIMKEVWESIENSSPEVVAATVAEQLVGSLSMPIVMIDEDASAFIKQYLK